MERKLIEEKLRNYLCAYWLRPETAIWRVCDWLAIKDFNFQAPMLDLACGDGINSYIIMGGTLPLEIDDSLSTMDVTAEQFFGKYEDIYNFSEEKSFPECPPPPKQFDVGLDWKQDLLNKAKQLNVFEKLVQHDFNEPLPFENKTFKTIFSNSIYWAKNVQGLLKELSRILKDDGRIIALLTTDTLNKYYLYNLFEKNNWRWCKYLDRGRFFHSQQRLSKEKWLSLFAEAGLKINQMNFSAPSRVVKIHEVGLRPISPVLIKMANSLTPEKRKEIKKEWIDYLNYLILPMFDGWLDDPNQEQCYIAVELIKSSG